MHQPCEIFKSENEPPLSVSKEGRGYRRGEPSDIATLRWFPSPKDLHVLNPKRFLMQALLAKGSLTQHGFIKKYL